MCNISTFDITTYTYFININIIQTQSAMMRTQTAPGTSYTDQRADVTTVSLAPTSGSRGTVGSLVKCVKHISRKTALLLKRLSTPPLAVLQLSMAPPISASSWLSLGWCSHAEPLELLPRTYDSDTSKDKDVWFIMCNHFSYKNTFHKKPSLTLLDEMK